MRKLLLLFCTGYLQTAVCQVTADPATGQMDITALDGSPLNANFIAPNNIVRLKVPVYNLNQLSSIPSGSCKIRISLGSNFVIDPGFNLSNAALSNYFTWTSAIANGEVEITGDLIAALPADFTGESQFSIKGPLLGTSTIIDNFLITNHNTTTPLTDEDPNNNYASLQYTITNETIPVNFIAVNALVQGCRISCTFTVGKEINVKQYEIETSNDGAAYTKAGILKANNSLHYGLDFYLQQATGQQNVFLRVRSVDYDGKSKISETKLLKGVCEHPGKINLYAVPNPAHGHDIIIRTNDNKPLTGEYQLILSDLIGRTIKKNVLSFSNVNQFNYTTGNVSAGTYLLKICDNSRALSTVLKIVKLN